MQRLQYRQFKEGPAQAVDPTARSTKGACCPGTPQPESVVLIGPRLGTASPLSEAPLCCHLSVHHAGLAGGPPPRGQRHSGRHR